MLDQTTRELKERALRPIAIFSSGIDPTTITTIALVFGVFAAVTAAMGLYPVALALWFVNRILDGLDGTIARLNNKQSDMGGYVDILFDYVVYALIPLSIVYSQPSDFGWLALSILFVVYYVNTASWMYLSSILEKRMAGATLRGEKTSVTMPGGLVGGTETIIVYTLFLLIPWAHPYLFLVFAGMIFFTIVQRLIWAGKNLN